MPDCRLARRNFNDFLINAFAIVCWRTPLTCRLNSDDVCASRPPSVDASASPVFRDKASASDHCHCFAGAIVGVINVSVYCFCSEHVSTVEGYWWMARPVETRMPILCVALVAPTFVTSTTFVTAHQFRQFISTAFVDLTTFVNFCQLRAHQFCQQ